MNNEQNSIKNLFISDHIPVSDLWLGHCISWCKEEEGILSTDYSLEELKSAIYTQWLNLDLKDVELPALPPNLITKKLFTLNGIYNLQVLQIVNIAKSKLWQLQTIRKQNVSSAQQVQESEREPYQPAVVHEKRMLQLVLTDGVQDIKAIEYNPISCLSLDMCPGVKIQLRGPVTIRRGLMMLKECNIKVLGGDVEEIRISNAVENVLARALKLPENPNPGPIEGKVLAEVERGTLKNITQNHQINIPNSYKINSMTAKPQGHQINTNSTINTNSVPTKQPNYSRETEKVTKPAAVIPPVDPFDDDFDFNDFEQIEQKLEISQPIIEQQSTNLNQRIELNSVSRSSNNTQELPSCPINRKDQICNDKIEMNLSNSNIISIQQLLKCKKDVNIGLYRIKARFKSIAQKLTVNDNEFKLVIKVEDDSGELSAHLHTDIIAGFAECTPSTMQELRTSIIKNNGNAAENLMEILQKILEKLQELDAVMVIETLRNEDTSTIKTIL